MKRKVRFTSTLEKSQNKLWGAHVRVPAEVVRKIGTGTPLRVVCSLNNAAEYQTAILPVANGGFVIRVNKKRRESLGLRIGTEVEVRLHKDTSEYGLPMPEEFSELLRQDEEARTLFEGLTRGRQRTLLYIVGSPKNDDKRAERAVLVARHLKTRKGKIDYRELYGMLKSKSHWGP
jgi:hypothetical protein